MSLHNYVTALNAEERRRDFLARAEASRLARIARIARGQRPARAWPWRGWRLVARPRPAVTSPRRPLPDAAGGQEREAVLTPGPTVGSGSLSR